MTAWLWRLNKTASDSPDSQWNYATRRLPLAYRLRQDREAPDNALEKQLHAVPDQPGSK
jgi:hypothetical protein